MSTKSSPAGAAPPADRVLAAIGNTPLVELPHFSRGAARIFAKLEWFNPGGSVKDRIAKAMIDDAEQRGLLAAGGTIVEATSGNTGVALAMVAASKHYRCVIVMPEGYGDMKARLMRGLGAEVVRTPSDAMMIGAIERASQIVRETPGAYLPNQFYNPVNPQTHYETTGPEIAAQIGGPIDAWVAGVGTTGTLHGCRPVPLGSEPRIAARGRRAAGIDPRWRGSGPHDVEGIGLSRIWPILDRALMDEVLEIRDKEAFDTCRALAREEGLLVGGSAGAAAAGALRIAERLGPGKTVVTLLPDGAERYPDQGIFAASRPKG